MNISNSLFDSIKVGNLSLRNKFVLSAAADNLDNDLIAKTARFKELANGGVGLIISGGITEDKLLGWDAIINTVHQNGGKLAVQLVTHAGLGFSSEGDSVAVSVLLKDSPFFSSLLVHSKHHEANDEELEEIINGYSSAAFKAKALGADAVQIHAAHQSFLSQFLSPITNQRGDKWGGSIINRTRIHREIYKEIRKKVGKDFPILIKLGVEDAIPNGLKFNEGKEAAEIVANCGYDILEISQGLQDFSNWNGTPMRDHPKTEFDEGYFRNWCKEIKNLISKPTIMTGGLRSISLIEEIIYNKETDLIGLCRPLIREPRLINRWKDEDLKKSSCISCNKCVSELLMQGKKLECYLDQ